jgi:hypothetical protein
MTIVSKKSFQIFLAAVVFSVQAAAQEGSLFNVGNDEVKDLLQQYFQQVDSALIKGDIRLAKQKLSFIEFKLQKHKDVIGKDEKKTYTERMNTRNAGVKHIIDSLVQVNLTIVSKKGRTAGIEFRQQLAARGLTETQLMSVDNAIVNASSSEEIPQEPSRPAASVEPVRPSPSPKPISFSEPSQVEPQPEKATVQAAPPKQVSVKEPAAPAETDYWHLGEKSGSSEETGQTPVISWPKEPSETKAQDHASTAPVEPFTDIESQKGKAQAEANARKTRSLIDDGRIDEAMTVFQIYHDSMEKFLPDYVYTKLKSDLEAANNRDLERRAQAARLLRGIDDLVDQNRSAEALDRLRANRELLQQCLEKNEFARLEEKVGRASVAFGKAQAGAQARAREIRSLLAENVNEAIPAFGRSQEELKQYLPKDAFEQLRNDVTSAEGRIRDKKKQCQLYRRDILGLIEQGKGPAAFALFSENKFFLRAYLDDSTFSSLAASAANANTEFYSRQAKAKAQLLRIDSLIAAKRIEQARDLFSSDKNALRSGLADDKRFFELKDRVSASYDEFSKMKKQASRSIKKITSLIQHDEGREANLTFLQDAGLLKEFLDAGVYAKLAADVQNASRNFEAGALAARNVATGIESFLKQNRFEIAFTTFKAIRDTFDHYLPHDPVIEALAKRTDSCYTAYRKHIRWTADIVDDIQWFINGKKGNQAKDLFEKERPQLSLYIEPLAFSTLESAVKNAYNQYVADKTLAEKNTQRLNDLLDRKRFEEAYKLFKELHASLEHYLPEATFTILRNEVTNAYEEFQEKNKRAHDYANNLKDLVWKKKVKEARKGFKENQKSLKLYLDAATYADLEKTVIGAAKTTAAKAKGGKRK